MQENKISRRNFLRVAGASATAAAVSGLAPSAAACDIKNLWSMDLQILATSDTHGKFDPWDYAANKEDASGSVAQQATAIREARTKTTLVVDAGDTIQANSAELFLNDEIHPMIAAQNAIGYDVYVTGNHEYNYGMATLEKVLSQQKAKVLTGNVYSPEGKPLADGYTIINKGGVKIGVIGMVTPNITRWDAKNLEGWTVTNPVDESRKIIDKIKNDVDVIIGVMHMDVDNEYGVYGSGVTDLANACPEFDVIVAAHGHKSIPNKMINGVLVVENKNAGATVSDIHVYLERGLNGKWKVKDRTSENLIIKDYAPDPELTALLAEYDQRAKDDAVTPIGQLVGGDLAPENEIDCLPQAMVQDTALLDFINEVQMYYTDAQVAATALTSMTSQMREGNVYSLPCPALPPVPVREPDRPNSGLHSAVSTLPRSVPAAGQRSRDPLAVCCTLPPGRPGSHSGQRAALSNSGRLCCRLSAPPDDFRQRRPVSFSSRSSGTCHGRASAPGKLQQRSVSRQCPSSASRPFSYRYGPG